MTVKFSENILTTFKNARKVSVPLIVVRTNDPAATVATMATAAENGKGYPVMKWDNVNGLRALNSSAQSAMANMKLGKPINLDGSVYSPADAAAGRPAVYPSTIADVEMLVSIGRAPSHAAIFVQNAHLIWTAKDKQTLQAIWNLRDQFKGDYRTLILLTPFAAAIPAELASDVMSFEEPLPTKERLAGVVEGIYASVGQTATQDAIDKATDALAGARSEFAAEQNLAVCMTKNGHDQAALWDRKEAMINETPGLTYVKPKMKFADLGGLDAAKQFLTRLFNGEAPPSVIIFVDEIDDMFAGVGSDTSGVATVLHGKFLSNMTKTGSKGALMMGHPGVAKSALIEAASAEFGVPMVAMDMGDVKNSLVGASEERMAQMLGVIDAISFGRALYIGTCNSVGNLSPQLQRRFPWRFFFDLPTATEKTAIWPIYEKRPYVDAAGPLTKAQLADRPDDTDWTGAEIKECCENAWRFKVTLKEAANYVVPIAQSMPEQIDERRKDAANRYLSASYPGVYRLKNESPVHVLTVPFGAVPRAIAEMTES